MRSPLPSRLFRFEPAHIPNIPAPIGLGIGIDDLAIKPRTRYTEPISMTHHWGRIHRENDNLAGPPRAADEGNDTVIGIMKIDSLETFIGVIKLPECRLSLINVIKMLHQPSQSIVTSTSAFFTSSVLGISSFRTSHRAASAGSRPR